MSEQKHGLLHIANPYRLFTFLTRKLLRLKMCLREHKLLHLIEPYTLVSKCFSKYISWICENVKENDLDDYDLSGILSEKEFQQLQVLENLLEKSLRILGMTASDFSRIFGFGDDLLVADPKKVHDILAEPLLAVDLDSQGFSSIQKIPRSVKAQGKLIPMSDFVATLGDRKLAIELKTIRTESWAEKVENGQIISDSAGGGGPALTPSWWKTMFRNNAITKIEDKNRRVILQLENAANHYGCDSKMLVLYTCRLSTSTLMSQISYTEELKQLRNSYPEIDYFCAKDDSGKIVFYPGLS